MDLPRRTRVFLLAVALVVFLPLLIGSSASLSELSAQGAITARSLGYPIILELIALIIVSGFGLVTCLLLWFRSRSRAENSVREIHGVSW